MRFDEVVAIILNVVLTIVRAGASYDKLKLAQCITYADTPHTCSFLSCSSLDVFNGTLCREWNWWACV